MSGQRVVEAARGWIGTPYVHQAAVRGAGTDCLGLVRGVWREVVGGEPEAVPAYTPDWDEAAGREVLWAAAARLMREKPVGEAAAGDVLLFRMRAGAVAKHLAIQGEVGPRATFIHAMSGARVVESPFSAPWARRVVARFVLPAG